MELDTSEDAAGQEDALADVWSQTFRVGGTSEQIVVGALTDLPCVN